MSTTFRAVSLGKNRIVAKGLFPNADHLPARMTEVEQREMNRQIDARKDPIDLDTLEVIIDNSFPLMGYEFYHMITFYPGISKKDLYWQITSSMMDKAIYEKKMHVPFILFVEENGLAYAFYVRFSRTGRLDPRAIEFYIYSGEKEHSIPEGVWKFIESMHLCIMAAVLGTYPGYCTITNGKIEDVTPSILKNTADAVLNKPIIKFEKESVPPNMRTIAALWWLHQVIASGRPNFQQDMNMQCPRRLSDLIGWYFTHAVG